jgi:hypothetical protein
MSISRMRQTKQVACMQNLLEKLQDRDLDIGVRIMLNLILNK